MRKVVGFMFWRFQRFLMGRNGSDALFFTTFGTGLVFSILGGLFFRPLYLVADALYIYSVFRAFSKNIPARRRENEAFLRFWQPIGKWFRFERRKFKERQAYKYFRCPACKQQLRAPRNRGEIEVTCQRCGKVFRTRT